MNRAAAVVGAALLLLTAALTPGVRADDNSPAPDPVAETAPLPAAGGSSAGEALLDGAGGAVPTTFDAMQFGDPLEGIVVINPPVPDNTGAAILEHPIEVPPGRNGLAPELSLVYDSRAQNGWLGAGWNLEVGAVTIDTRWGVPRYDAGFETETYLLDGEQLAPTARRDVLLTRSVDRVFTKRVEGDFSRIVRRGDLGSYWFEVTDKAGTTRYFGGLPGQGRIAGAVLTTASGRAFHWALVRTEDISGNTIDYFYEKQTGPVGASTITGQQLYLSTIDYTGRSRAPGPFTAPYRIEFGRDGSRVDVLSDASNGAVTVTTDRLTSIDVKHRRGNSFEPVRGYDLRYVTGPLRVSQLEAVDQRDASGVVVATHSFLYANSVGSSAALTLFEDDAVTLDTHDDDLSVVALGESSALGSSTTRAEDGRLYTGFNPFTPSKTGSVGGGFAIGGSVSESIVELVDLNGDGLVDKVFREPDASFLDEDTIYYRLNGYGPDGTTTFGEKHVVVGITRLPRQTTFSTFGGPEAYPGPIGLMYHVGATWVRSTSYFLDVNADLLPDFVTKDTVYFNRLVDGVPTFIDDGAAGTSMPLGPGTVNAVTDDEETRRLLKERNPLVDAVRRWVAPFDGTVSISAAAPVVVTHDEGARLAVQRNGAEVWSVLLAVGDSFDDVPEVTLDVAKGDRLYFRVQSLDVGLPVVADWDPIVEYTDFADSTDVNGRSTVRFQASEDFIVAGRPTPISIPWNGRLAVTGEVTKGATSDEVEVVALVRDIASGAEVRYGLGTLGPGDGALTPDLADIPVTGLDAGGGPTTEVELWLAVESTIDAATVSWSPTLSVLDAEVGAETRDAVVASEAPYAMDLYTASDLTAPPQSWSGEGPTSVDVSVACPLLDIDCRLLLAQSPVTFTLKTGSGPLARVVLDEVGSGTVTFDAESDTEYWLEFTTRDGALLNRLQTEAEIDGDDVPSALYTPTPEPSESSASVFSQPFRGWGYAGYTGPSDTPMDEPEFVLSESDFPEFDEDDPSAPTNRGHVFTPVQSPAQPGIGPPSRWAMSRSDDVPWVSADRSTALRLGAGDLAPGATGSRGLLIRASSTDQRSFAANLLGLFGGVGGWGTSQAKTDYIDLNGDGFPDPVWEGGVQFTTPTGGLSDPIDYDALSVIRSDSQASAALGGGVPVGIKFDSSGDGDGSNAGGETGSSRSGAGGGDAPKEKASDSAAGAMLGFAGSLGTSHTNDPEWGPGFLWPDEVERDLVDLNGDGLPDRVRVLVTGEIWVALNLGYGFTSEEMRWDTGDVEGLEVGHSRAVDLGGELGFNIGNYAFSGGVSAMWDNQLTDLTWTDLTGDGLPDALWTDGTSVWMAQNTGSGLAGAQEVLNWPADGAVGAVDTFGLGGGADFTIPIGPLCLAGCYIIVNPGGHGEQSLSVLTAGLADVDGDGRVDHLSSTNDGEIDAVLNRVGTTGLLERVDTPTGATYTLSYGRYGNTTDLPFSVWALTEVVVDDGVTGDGVDTTRHTYDYYGGRFDVTERAFYGFQTINETFDGQGLDDRSWERTYRTDSYYTKGLLAGETQFAAGVPRAASSLSYATVDSATGTDVDPAGEQRSLFTRLVAVDDSWFDGAEVKRTAQTFGYDIRGNVVREVDAGEMPDPDDDRVTTSSFSDCPTWVTLPTQVTVTDGTGELLRQRLAVVSCDIGAVTRVSDLVSVGGPEAVSDYTYDAYGNVVQIDGPGDPAGPRVRWTWAFDPDYGTPMRVDDPWGGTATATWDRRVGRIATFTDENDATWRYEYDSVGRIAAAAGPVPAVTGVPDLSYTYGGGPQLWARIDHADPEHPGDPISSVVFVDGIGRVTHYKHDQSLGDASGCASGARVVKGQSDFNAFGEDVRQYDTVCEDGALPIETPASHRSDEFVELAYDDFGRLTRQVLPSGDEHTFHYELAPLGPNLLFRTTETNAEGQVIVTYDDARGNKVAEEERPASGGGAGRWTTYAYDAVQQLRATTDHAGRVTSQSYDLLGRRTETESPAQGPISFAYDLAGNLITKTTTAVSGPIRYRYEQNRLVAIRYPDHPDNDVAVEYGKPGGDPNAVGRMVRVEDGSRVARYAYDAAGRLASETVTMKVHNLSARTAPAHTYTTSYVYDTWGRLQELGYPDGETLSFGYDGGGLLQSVTGTHGPITTSYVSQITYDANGLVTGFLYGNGVRTRQSYDPLTLRLSAQTVFSPTAVVQNLAYTYDRLGNVLTRTNSVVVGRAEERFGPSEQTFEYDGFFRLSAATGTYEFAPNKRTEYTLDIDYDAQGRVTRKAQTERVFTRGNKRGVPQRPTTYTWNYKYEGDTDLTPIRIGDRTYSFDETGEFLAWQSNRNSTSRTVTYDEEHRVTSIAQQGATTTYAYTAAGDLAIERGPQGEVEYVNRWYTVLNGKVAHKHVWMDQQRVATKLVTPKPRKNTATYYYTADLVGSVNIVTDEAGDVYEHVEYLPSGELWVRESGEVFRNPYLFAGAYYDEFRDVAKLGTRWYDAQAGFFFTADPALISEPRITVSEPRLLDAYTYANESPASFVDPSGTLTAISSVQRTRNFGAIQGLGRLRAFVNVDLDLKDLSTAEGIARTRTQLRAAVDEWAQGRRLGAVRGRIALKIAEIDLSPLGRRFKSFWTFEIEPLVEIKVGQAAGKMFVRRIGVLFGAGSFERGNATDKFTFSHFLSNAPTRSAASASAAPDDDHATCWCGARMASNTVSAPTG